MKTSDRVRAEARSRASRRLRNMTIGTAILGVAATGSLGWAAAGTPVGGTATSSSAATVTTATTQPHQHHEHLDCRNGRPDGERPGGHGVDRERPRKHRGHLTPVAPDAIGQADELAGPVDDPAGPVGAVIGQAAEPAGPVGAVIAQADWRALGTGVRLLVLDGDLARARSAVERVLDEVDLAYSRFRPDSELMAVNAAAGRTVHLGPLLARALQGVIDAARRTGGAVDPTVGRALRVVGYDADFGLLAGTTRPIELRVAPVPGWSSMAFDPHARTLRVPPGVELDLGSTGKGLAADLAAAAALEATGAETGVLVSLGGDIATAGRVPDGGWRILLSEDSNVPSDSEGEVIAIQRGAVATSSTTVRRWGTSEGVTVHHIIDPRTGLPADTPWRTATVVAATCEEANAASTAAIVIGAAAPAWIEAAGLPARLVANDGSIVRLAGWPEPSGLELATGP